MRDKGSRGDEKKERRRTKEEKTRERGELKKREEEEKRQLSKDLFNHEIRLNDEKWGGNKELEKIG